MGATAWALVHADLPLWLLGALRGERNSRDIQH
jgi:hypothetical protein